jgi:ribosomal protein S6E (S10)
VTDADVIAAIHRQHLKANIARFEADPSVTVRWDLARVDPGGTIFGAGPYLKVPVRGGGDWDGTVHRVYAPERLRKRLAAQWRGRRTGRTLTGQDAPGAAR